MLSEILISGSFERYVPHFAFDCSRSFLANFNLILHGDVPKRLKGLHSKCSRTLIASREFKSLHLRQIRTLILIQSVSKLGFLLFARKRLENRAFRRFRRPCAYDYFAASESKRSCFHPLSRLFSNG